MSANDRLFMNIQPIPVKIDWVVDPLIGYCTFNKSNSFVRGTFYPNEKLTYDFCYNFTVSTPERFTYSNFRPTTTIRFSALAESDSFLKFMQGQVYSRIISLWCYSNDIVGSSFLYYISGYNDSDYATLRQSFWAGYDVDRNILVSYPIIQLVGTITNYMK